MKTFVWSTVIIGFKIIFPCWCCIRSSVFSFLFVITLTSICSYVGCNRFWSCLMPVCLESKLAIEPKERAAWSVNYSRDYSRKSWPRIFGLVLAVLVWSILLRYRCKDQTIPQPMETLASLWRHNWWRQTLVHLQICSGIHFAFEGKGRCKDVYLQQLAFSGLQRVVNLFITWTKIIQDFSDLIILWNAQFIACKMRRQTIKPFWYHLKTSAHSVVIMNFIKQADSWAVCTWIVFYTWCRWITVDGISFEGFLKNGWMSHNGKSVDCERCERLKQLELERKELGMWRVGRVKSCHVIVFGCCEFRKETSQTNYIRIFF